MVLGWIKQRTVSILVRRRALLSRSWRVLDGRERFMLSLSLVNWIFKRRIDGRRDVGENTLCLSPRLFGFGVYCAFNHG